MKNVFRFMLKALFVKIFTFLLWFFGYVDKWFNKKALVKVACMVKIGIYGLIIGNAN